MLAAELEIVGEDEEEMLRAAIVALPPLPRLTAAQRLCICMSTLVRICMMVVGLTVFTGLIYAGAFYSVSGPVIQLYSRRCACASYFSLAQPGFVFKCNCSYTFGANSTPAIAGSHQYDRDHCCGSCETDPHCNASVFYATDGSEENCWRYDSAALVTNLTRQELNVPTADGVMCTPQQRSDGLEISGFYENMFGGSAFWVRLGPLAAALFKLCLVAVSGFGGWLAIRAIFDPRGASVIEGATRKAITQEREVRLESLRQISGADSEDNAVEAIVAETEASTVSEAASTEPTEPNSAAPCLCDRCQRHVHQTTKLHDDSGVSGPALCTASGVQIVGQCWQRVDCNATADEERHRKYQQTPRYRTHLCDEEFQKLPPEEQTRFVNIRCVHIGPEDCATWAGLTAIGANQTTWEEARVALGMDMKQALWVSRCKLVLWHWSQPLAYLAILTEYFCELSEQQRYMAAAVAVRELMYLATTVIAYGWVCPAFVLLELKGIWKDGGRWAVDTTELWHWAIYLFSPHYYVTYCLNRKMTRAEISKDDSFFKITGEISKNDPWGQSVFMIGMLEAVGDLCTVCALMELLALDTAPLALAIGFYMPVLGLLVGAISFLAFLVAGMKKGFDSAHGTNWYLVPAPLVKLVFLLYGSITLGFLFVVVVTPLKLSGLVQMDNHGFMEFNHGFSNGFMEFF